MDTELLKDVETVHMDITESIRCGVRVDWQLLGRMAAKSYRHLLAITHMMNAMINGSIVMYLHLYRSVPELRLKALRGHKTGVGDKSTSNVVTKTIFVERTPTQVFTLYHEAGHVALFSQRCDSMKTLWNEIAAWDWAIQRAVAKRKKNEWICDMVIHARQCLMTYCMVEKDCVEALAYVDEWVQYNLDRFAF